MFDPPGLFFQVDLSCRRYSTSYHGLLGESAPERLRQEDIELETKRRWWEWLLLLLFGAAAAGLAVVTVLRAGTAYHRAGEVHWTPDYGQVELLPLLEKPSRTAEDYKILYAQTGLTPLGIEDLLAAGDIQRILTIQENYFRDYTVQTSSFAPFTCTQTIDDRAAYTQLKNGDIIVSSSTFFSWFRCGHAAMMVDEATRTLVNAVEIGTDSALDPIEEFGQRANFMVLRPKLPQMVREQAAAYAREHLVGLPYSLTAGLLPGEEVVTATQCAHLVWYAYQQFGVDLDATGGPLVTPRDLATSPLVELVQTFGFDPQELWG